MKNTATAKQLGFLEKLHAERGLDLPDGLFSLSTREASSLISSLLATPKASASTLLAQPAPRPQMLEGLDVSSVKAGRYQVPGLAVVFDHGAPLGRWAGWVFVKDTAGNKVGAQRPGQRYQGAHGDLLSQVVANPLAALLEYGRQSGTCGHCGRALTEALSVAAGIGPVCADRWGIDRSEYEELAAKFREATTKANTEGKARVADAKEHEAAEAAWNEAAAATVAALLAANGVPEPEAEPFELDPFDLGPAPARVVDEYDGPDTVAHVSSKRGMYL